VAPSVQRATRMSTASLGLPAVAAAALAAGAALVIGLASLGGVDQAATSSSLLTIAEQAAQTCPVTGPVTGLTPEQAANADTIVSASMATSGESTRAARIAVMTAMTESGLYDLDRGDRDSLGLFQQRPSQGWGTPAQIMDPVYATVAFVRRLLTIERWQQIAPWLAAQAVQRSADNAGTNYEANWQGAGPILAGALANGNVPGGCGQGSGGLAGKGGHGLPAGYAIPAGTPREHAEVVRFALAQLGKPYVWGGAGPAAYDCSGLTMAAWATAGVALEHASSVQQTEGAAVTAADIIPGDLVLVPGSDSPGPGLAGHVGIYLGDGLVISAIDPRFGVAVQTWTTFVSGGLIALRDPAPGEKHPHT
jgi:cell wall-associated NlpC family hydrolase